MKIFNVEEKLSPDEYLAFQVFAPDKKNENFYFAYEPQVGLTIKPKNSDDIYIDYVNSTEGAPQQFEKENYIIVVLGKWGSIPEDREISRAFKRGTKRRRVSKRQLGIKV